MGCTQGNRNPKAGRIQDEEKLLAESFMNYQQSMHEHLPKIIRQDLSTIKQPQAPKNDICLVSVSQELLPLLEQACNQEDKSQIKVNIESLTQIFQMQTSQKQSEIIFCQNMAKTHLAVLSKNNTLLNTILKLTECFQNKLQTFVEDIQSANMALFEATGETTKAGFNLGPFQYVNWDTFEPDCSMIKNSAWYDRYTYVMLSEAASFHDIFQLIAQNKQQLNEGNPEIKNFYTCVLVIIRFVEGISWGYSEMLLHEFIEKEILYTLKVVFEMLQAIKQFYREDRLFSSLLAQRDDVPSSYLPEPCFQAVQSLNQLDRQIVHGLNLNEYQQHKHGCYLLNQIFRKTYVLAKREIDDWLRAYSYNSVKTTKPSPEKVQTTPKVYLNFTTIEEVKYKVQTCKTLRRDFIRKLKNPELNIEGQHVRTEKHSTQKKSKTKLGKEKPTFEIDNTQNIFLLTGAQTDTRVIIESFLQANVRIRSRYKCCVLHSCVRENKLSQDTYSIVKHIIYQVVKTVPAIQHLLLLQNHNYFAEFLVSKQQLNQQQRLQFDSADLFVKFCKILSQIKLDFNIAIFITGIENLYEQSNLQNLIYILRAASVYMPNYLKIVLTLEKRDSKIQQFEQCIKLLQTQKLFDIQDQKFFKQEARSFLDFAFTYQLQQQIDQEIVGNCKQKFVELCLAKSNESYRNLVDIIQKLQMALVQEDSKVKINEFDSIESFINEYQSEHFKLLPLVEEAVLDNPYFANIFFSILINIRGPISIQLFTRLVQALYYQQNATERSDIGSIEGLTETQSQQIDVLIIEGFKQNISEDFRQMINRYTFKFLDYLLVQNKIKGTIEDGYEYFTDGQINTKIDKAQILIVPKKRKMLKACLQMIKSENLNMQNKQIDRLMILAFLVCSELQTTDKVHYEQIDPYLRYNLYQHMSKCQTEFQPFSLFFSMFLAKNIFKQILFFGSYQRFRAQLSKVILSPFCEKNELQGLVFLVNTLYLVEQTVKYEPFSFTDFLSQLRGRFIGDSASKYMPEHKFDRQFDQDPQQFFTNTQVTRHQQIVKESEFFIATYFENFHHTLRENPRIDFICQMPGNSQVLALKFFSDKKRVVVSLSCGLILLIDTTTGQVGKTIINRFGVTDLLKVVDDKLLIAAGIDQKIRFWDIENEKNVNKFEIHPFATSQLIIYKDFMYSYGFNKQLVKTNYQSFKKIHCIEVSSHIQNMKLLKQVESHQAPKIVTTSSEGEIVLYDMDLKILQTTSKPGEDFIRIISLSLTDFLCFQKEGNISVLNSTTLDESKSGSIFSLKSDDYLDLVLIKSREYFLFTIEKQKIEFYSASNFKKSDSWDYFFERDIVGCDKNKEGSKICVWDKNGCLTLFNFLKVLDTQSKETHIPCHRRYDPVQCIDVSDKIPGSTESNIIISCSLDRDLRVWDRQTGVFVKKYDLSSFTAESVSAIKLGKTEGMLFLGSKDMNVYLIDVARGKLCVVYEGHWSRVTSIYIIPGKDILVTLSESNIKVWDLEYDECIKNMNEHNSLIVYCAISHNNEQNIVTISQSLEYKEWNYVTGQVIKAFTFNLNHVIRDKEFQQTLNATQRKKSTMQYTMKDSMLDQKSDMRFEEDSAVFDSDDEPNNSFDSDHKKRKQTEDKDQIKQKNNIASLGLRPQQKHFNLVACHIRKYDMIYLALDTNQIVIYSLLSKQVLFTFNTYQNETVVALEAIESDQADYLVVTSRTACILYLLQEDNVQRLSSYVINARKKPLRRKFDNKFSYSLRFYFTSASIQKIVETEDSIMLSGQTSIRGDHKDKSKQLNILTTGQHATTTQTKHELTLLTGTQHADGHNQETTQQGKKRRTKFLVCIGDSRGFVHMAHLNLN